MSAPTILSNIYAEYKRRTGDSKITLVQCIQDLNYLLFLMNVTKPAEQITKLYYCQGYDLYATPSEGFRDAIGLYSERTRIIRYVSPLRFRLEDPSLAYTDQVDRGKRFLKIRHDRSDSQKSLITMGDNLTADGAWTITNGSNLAINTTTYKEGAGSLSFDVGGTTITLTFARTSVIDASTFTEQMRLRFYAWFPTAPSSVEVRIGSSGSNYFTHTLTTQVTGEGFVTEGANELEFSRGSASETGTVDLDNIDYFRIIITFSSSTTDTDFLLNYINLIKPEELEFEWYSNYVGMDSDGNIIQKITEDASTTDQPIIQAYPDYINTVIDGMSAGWLRMRHPERAGMFEGRFRSIKADGKLIGGIEFLHRRYPNRMAVYKRKKTLPPLYRGSMRLRGR